MTGKLFLILSISIWTITKAQHSPYSLQAAVDALHRREAQLALRDNYNLPTHYIPSENDYWDEEPEVPAPHDNRHQLNRLLARYLTRDGERDRTPGPNTNLIGLDGNGGYENDFDEDNYLPDEKKRSFFRERDGKYDIGYPTVFRERELEPIGQPELAEEFLREIEHERDLEKEEKYRETLRRLWEKYQQQENEIEQELFDEEKKKRQSSNESPQYFVGPLMEKKRSYPVLPWLPATRKKRFPVAKRSPKMPNEEINVSGTDQKVAHDLQAIFGQASDEKKKRSSGDEPVTTETSNKDEKKTNDHTSHGNHDHHDHSEDDEHEESESEEHEHEHDHPEEDEDDHDFDDEDDEDRKKKREIEKKRSNPEVIREDQIIPGDLSNFRKKKSIQWSKYFGIDRRKKSDNSFMAKNTNEIKKRSPTELDDEDKQKKKNSNGEKLDNMDHKLKTIEDLIIDETVKYTGAHEGTSDPDEVRQVKDHVVSRLATAYSLEKMRHALDKLRQSVDNENHLQHNEIESDDKKMNPKEKEKRVAIKKEKVNFENNHQSANPPSTQKSHDSAPNDLDQSNDDDNKKKKKRNGLQRYPDIPNDLGDFEEELGAGHYEPLNDVYLGNKMYNAGPNECPILDSMAERCRGVDILSGDVHQNFLPICGVHQLCYLCGTSQIACDFQFLSKADSICGHNNECQIAARSTLMILRGVPGPQLGPKECLKNSCLYRAMREIGL